MLRYLALGDSYSIGEGVDAADSWPHRLAARLQQRCGAPVAVEVIAATGWSADELLPAMAASVLVPPFDLVSVLIGVNDQYRGREVAEHLPHFNTVLTQAVGLADGDPGRVLVVSIPDWGTTGFGADDARGPALIAGQIDAYNAAQRELCRLRGIAYVDITALSRAAGADPAMLVADRLHPSGAQYARWLEPIAAAAAQALAPARS
jgi:lysophospholipase L1-like esterase